MQPRESWNPWFSGPICRCGDRLTLGANLLLLSDLCLHGALPTTWKQVGWPERSCCKSPRKLRPWHGNAYLGLRKVCQLHVNFAFDIPTGHWDGKSHCLLLPLLLQMKGTAISRNGQPKGLYFKCSITAPYRLAPIHLAYLDRKSQRSKSRGRSNYKQVKSNLFLLHADIEPYIHAHV